MSKPIAGQVYERDGRKREVTGVNPVGQGYEVFWKNPASNSGSRACWYTTWESWASKATLVEPKE